MGKQCRSNNIEIDSPPSHVFLTNMINNNNNNNNNDNNDNNNNNSNTDSNKFIYNNKR